MRRLATHVSILARAIAAGPRPGEPVLLVAAATVIIGLGAVGVRAHSLPFLELTPHRVAATVAVRPVRTPQPPIPSPAPAPATHAAMVRPTSPLHRAEGIEVVIATARTLIGRPYRWGASGPDAFDCSGFTSFVWRRAGLELPHNSAAQYASLPRVPVSDLQPGDLVFSGSGRVSHTGLYVGGGMMIDAPETGRSVELEPLRGNLIGASRPALLLPEREA